MKVYVVAGEASGDARGAELLSALRARRPELDFIGLGGPRMRALAGEGIEDWIDQAGVIGFIDVLKHYPFFRRKFAGALVEIERTQPAAVLLIDYPGFNLRLAAAIKKRARPPRVLYYISPQVWAWHRSRIPKMARTIDLMLCLFPFEKPLYEQSGLRTEFVGHPMLDSLRAERSSEPRQENLVALLPGSRQREVKKIFPTMLATAALMQRARPDLQFAAAAASEQMRAHMQAILAEQSIACALTLRDSHQLMQRAAVGMVASGTATLEASFFQLPFALLYKTAWLTFFVGRRVVQVPHLGMANILAGREIVREFLQDDAEPPRLADYLLPLLASPTERAKLIAETDAVIAQLGPGGAAERAAELIVHELAPR